jgi:MerR family transcriptional regulator/heat shock protein HspR
MVFKTSDALYVISVAARLVALHPTTLRKYERVGFLEPSRTSGRTRLYSLEDIRRLRQIKHLVEEREMNLAGVQMALAVTERLRHVASMLETERDPAKLRQRLAAPIEEALTLVGATD